jgi:hypothetical protein
MLSRAICWLDGAPCIGLLYPLKLLERHKFSIAQRGLLRFAVMVLWLRNSQKDPSFQATKWRNNSLSSYVLQHDEIICGIKKLCRCDAGFQFSARARRTLKFHFANYARSNSPGLGKGCSHPSFRPTAFDWKSDRNAAGRGRSETLSGCSSCSIGG